MTIGKEDPNKIIKQNNNYNDNLINRGYKNWDRYIQNSVCKCQK